MPACPALPCTHSDTSSNDPWDSDLCFDPTYRKRTLKVIKEMPYIGLFEDLKVRWSDFSGDKNIAAALRHDVRNDI